MKCVGSKGYSRRFWLCCAVCLICATLIKPTQDRLEPLLSKFRQDPDLLFFSSPALVKKMSFGFEGLLADFYWMRTIQYYGRRDEADKRAIRYKNLSTLLDITTTLDPHLLDAYRAGAYFLAEADPVGAGKPEQAIQLLDKGIRAHPQEWRLFHDKGFMYYWYLKDYKAAGEVWQSASRLQDAPYWISSLAAMSLSRGGAIEIAIALWEHQYRESNRADVRENARNHLLSIRVSQDLSRLKVLAEKYKEQIGIYPPSLKDLQRGSSSALPIEDPLGTPYQYDSRNGSVQLSPKSTVRYLPVPQFQK
jgi:tetratricopeptide (TPR) repeat protein